MKNLVKTKFPGVYYKLDQKTKIKTFVARIKIVGLNTEQIVGYSNDSIKTNASLAYQKRTELINKFKNGESIRISDNPTFDNFFVDYLQNKKLNKKLSLQKINIYNYFYKTHIPTNLKQLKMKQLKKDDFQKVINTMVKDEYKPSYIETIKSCFSPIFNDAIEKEIVSKNIIKYLEFPKYDQNRYFSLSDDKAKALVNEIMNLADNQYRVMFMFLLRGRRAGEVLSMKWENINFEKKIYIVDDSQSKIKKNLTFVMDEELINHLKFLEIKKEGIIFVSPVTGKKFFSVPVRVWKRIKNNAGIKDMKLHDFRHLLGFTLVNNNVPLESISRALGHSKITTTQRYSNQKEEMAKEAVDIFLGIVKK